MKQRDLAVLRQASQEDLEDRMDILCDVDAYHPTSGAYEDTVAELIRRGGELTGEEKLVYQKNRRYISYRDAQEEAESELMMVDWSDFQHRLYDFEGFDFFDC